MSITFKNKIIATLFSSSIILLAGCDAHKNTDLGSPMIAAQSEAIVANEVRASMSKALESVVIVEAKPASGVTATTTTALPVVGKPAPAS